MWDKKRSSPKNWTLRFFLIVLLAAFIPTTTVALFTLNASSQALRAEAETKLSVSNDSIRQQLIRWTNDNRSNLVFASKSSEDLVKKLEKFFQLPSENKQREEVKRAIVNNEIKRFLDQHDNFFELFFIDLTTGEVVISSAPEEEGKLKTDRPYFINGKKETYAQSVYFSLTLQQQATTIATPVLNTKGDLVAVLAGRVSLSTLNEVLKLPEGLGVTANSYAVNSFKFITAGLQESQETERGYYFRPLNTLPVLEGLKGNAGVATYSTYNDVIVVGSYLPIPELGVVVITEIQEDEILLPIQSLRLIVLVVTASSFLVVATIAIQTTRNIISSTQKYRFDLEQTKKSLEKQNVTLVRNALSMTEYRNELEDKNNEIVEALDQTKELSNVIASEKKQTETLLQSLTDGVLAVDRDNKIILFNKAAESITGLSAKVVMGRNVDGAVRFYRKKTEGTTSGEEQEQVLIAQYTGQSVKSKKELAEEGVFMNSERGTTFITLTSAPVVFSETGGTGRIVTFQDITKEHELEEMKIDFVSMAAHELRTPLTSIRGYVKLLSKEIGDKLDQTHREDLRRISVSADKLASFVDNLLNVSRIERGTISVDLKPVDLLAIAQRVVADLEQRVSANGLTLKFVEPAEAIPQILGDKDRIIQVITNLVVNAMTYTDKGGTVTVFLGRTKPLNSPQGGDYVSLSVKDTGIGIPEQIIPKLFTKFYRVRKGLKKGPEGTGLGLYISKSILHMHKGEIWVDSIEGRGSTFTFAIPVVTTDNSRQQDREGGESKL